MKRLNLLTKKIIVELGLILGSLVATAVPAVGAERLTFVYPPFGEFSIAVRDLEIFAQERRITPDLAFYLKRIPPAQQAQLQNLLQRRFQLSPVYVSQLTYAPLGEKMLDRLGNLFQTDSRANGRYALRSALILAAADKTTGFTITNVIRQFPGHRIRLNLDEALAVADDLANLLQNRNDIMLALNQLASATTAQVDIGATQLSDLRVAGSIQWRKQFFNLRDRTRDRAVPFDLYLPETRSSAPVLVISHGVAEDRQTFAYLAEHLASHGFAVVALEHTGGDGNRLRRYLAGLEAPPAATELLDRPRDVTYVLDELQRQMQTEPDLQNRFNLEQVGLIGHSLGGYTILALAGATLNFEQVQKDCNPNQSLNLSVMLQCRATEIPPDPPTYQDARIKAVFAINPLSSTVFGKQGISQIRVPVAFVAGSDDIFTPAVPEQIRPFTWLQTPNKYLLLIEKGTHFSAQMPSTGEQTFPLPSSLTGPDPALVHAYMKALSLAFFQTHLLGQPEAQSYLSASYVRSLSQAPLTLNIFDASHTDRVAQILQDFSPRPATFKP
jgi:predicted dienelactone hydrolase